MSISWVDRNVIVQKHNFAQGLCDGIVIRTSGCSFFPYHFQAATDGCFPTVIHHFATFMHYRFHTWEIGEGDFVYSFLKQIWKITLFNKTNHFYASEQCNEHERRIKMEQLVVTTFCNEPSGNSHRCWDISNTVFDKKSVGANFCFVHVMIYLCWPGDNIVFPWTINSSGWGDLTKVDLW